MLYTIERRKVSGGGSVETVYEIRQYDGAYANGCLYGGKTLKEVKHKKTAEQCMRKRGLIFSYNRNECTSVYIRPEEEN